MERNIGQDFQNAERDRDKKNRTYHSRKRLRKDDKRDMDFPCICEFFYCLSFRSGSWRDFSGLISKVTLVRWAKKEGQNILPAGTEL